MSRMALWSGTPSYATKKQLVSSISGLYDDLQDFQFSTISAVSTLTVSEWLSAPVLYVSDIKGANIDISGIRIDASGVLFAPLVSSQVGTFSIVNVSTMKFEFNPTFSGDIKVTFDLGLGEAIGGLLAGLGAAVGGAFIGIGTGVGLAIQGAEQGIATMIAGRPQNFINNNVYETINFTSQLQVSTLGNAYPLYSTVIRTVSSPAADQVPGREIFLSTFFTPGTTCIRSVSDPFNLISGNSNLNTSTIQSFGQWVALPETSTSNFTNIYLSNATDSPLIEQYRTILSSNNQPMMNSLQWATSSNDINAPVNTVPYPNFLNLNRIFYHRDEYDIINTYISTPYVRFQSSFTTVPDPFFIRSNLSAPLELTYTNNITSGDFAFCEPDETGFRSTMEVDLIVNGTQDLFIQWGFAVDNLNSTIKAGTAKRVSWNIPASYSNFIDIPPALSTTVNEGTTQQILDIKSNPYEFQFNTFGTGMNPSQVAWNVNGMTFGSNTSLSNYNGYPYEFLSSVFINGTLEATTLIALSSIFATSTFVDTQVSTASIVADMAEITDLFGKVGYFSTLKSDTVNPTFDYITAFSRLRVEGFGTPLGIVTGSNSNFYDQDHRFDFQTDTQPQALYLTTYPANKTLAYFYSTNVEIPDLVVNNLTASNLTYGKAEAPTIQTSSITFGWTGNFTSPVTPAYALQQSLATEPGTTWNNYQAASTQVLNIMSFSNTVNMLAQQFSTPIQYVNSEYSSANRQGWASTIFYNAQANPVRAYLAPSAGSGELSFQAQTFNIVVFPNQTQAQGGVGSNIPVPVGSTYKFTSDGSQWTTTSNAPTPGFVQYNNSLQLTLDFETANLTTSDTLNLNAETINLNGVVVMPNAQLSNLYLDGFVSSQTSRAQTFTSADFNTSVNNSSSQPFEMFNTTTTTDGLTNIRSTVTPSRGFNLFNSYNYNEWNNTIFFIDTNASAGRPTLIVGEVIGTSPPFSPYAGQFWINNTVDSPALSIPVYVNQEGVLSNLGFINGNTFGRVFTSNGTTWFLQTNVANPNGSVNATFSNYYTVAMNSAFTTINTGMPLIYNTPGIVYNTNKVFFYAPQIRVATIDAPTFNTREAGMERTSYFDSNVVFSGGPETWQSDAYNPILGIYGNTYYSVAGWECIVSLNRLRTDNDIPMSWELTAAPYPVGGGAIDYVWGTARYLQVRTIGQPEANIREDILMIPKNYFNFAWQGQGPIN